VLLAGVVEVNALAQGALRQFTQWPWIEHPTFQLRGGHFITELLPPPGKFLYLFFVGDVIMGIALPVPAIF